MRFLYDNKIDDYTLVANNYYGAGNEITNIQDTRLGKVWRSSVIANKITYGDCESLSSPTLEGGYSGLSNATWARSAAQAYEGTYSWLLTKSSAGGGGDAEVYINDNYSSTTTLHNLSLEKYYRFDLRIYTDVATLTNAEVIFQEYYSAAWNNTLVLNPTGTGAWEKIEGAINTNALTTSVRIVIRIKSAEVISKLLYVDSVNFYEEARFSFDATALNPTATAILNHNLSSAAIIKLQGNATNDFTSPSVDETLTWNEDVIIKFISASSLRYWSFVFYDYDNTDTYIEIGRAFLGGYVELTKSSTYNLPINLMTMSKTKQNPSGQLFGIRNTQLRGYNINISMITQTDLDNFIALWEMVGIHKPFICILKYSLIATFPSLYCHLINEPKATYVFDDFYSLSMQIGEVK